MANFTGTPVTIDRFLGFADYTDPANLSLGLSPLVKNTDFSQGSAKTRDGIVTTMTGANPAPVTGLLAASYTPEDASEQFYRLFVTLDGGGILQVESPSGTGKMLPIQAWSSAVLVSIPANSHMAAVPAYNRGYSSYFALAPLAGSRYGFVPSAPPSVIDLATKRVDPYGLRPYGENWLAGEYYSVGEVVTPTITGGNGHTYRCTQAGSSGAGEPNWPVADSAFVGDGGVGWQEHTAVLANRLPIPSAPASTQVAGGTFATGSDVYTLLTSLNSQGETTGSPATQTTITGGTAVAVPGPALPAWITELVAPYTFTEYNVYAAVVATGSPAPPQSEFMLVGPVATGATLNVTAAGTGAAPPQRNSARLTPGMLPIPDVAATVQRLAAAGTFPINRDVWIRTTFQNESGETPLGPSSSVVNTVVDDAVQVTADGKDGYDVGMVGVYEADVATGATEPAKSAYALVGYYAVGSSITVSTTATGEPAPTANATGSSGNILADTATGGINAAQGMRYAAIMFQDFTLTISGFRQGAVCSTNVDEDGWGLGIYHVPTGPGNVMQRIIAPSEANGTSAGPFFEIAPAAVSDGVAMTATILPDNTSSSLLMDFTDAYLIAQTSLTYRLQTIKPKACVDLYYAPSVDRFFQCGVAGFSGVWISRAADAASYQGDVGYLSVGADGERTFAVREFRETLYALRERSGFVITPETANPSAWDASRRWSKVGPCGPRAMDVGKAIMPFVHRSGLHVYSAAGDPLNVLMKYLSNKEGKWWRRINWAYGETVWCSLDEEGMVIRVGLPLDQATSPSIVMSVWFPDGWDGDPRISIDDVAANLAMLVERDLIMAGDVDEASDAAYRTAQFIYASSAADGTVQAIQPGRKDDNGTGIDWVYRTSSAEEMLRLCKVEGYALDAEGGGEINVTLIGGRIMKNPAGVDGPTKTGYVLPLRPIAFDPDTPAIARYAPSKLSEQWSMQFDNGKQPGVWCDLKKLEMYILPFFQSR